MDAAKVQSLDSLRFLRAGLCKFIESAQSVLSEVDGELQRSLNWIQTEADSHWQGQIRSRQTAVMKAKDALRAKQLYKLKGFKPSVVDEEKALRQAIDRVHEAEAKLAAVHRYANVLAKEIMQYKGQVQKFTNSVAIDLPIAVGRLDAMLRHLEQYLGIKAAEGEEGAAVAGLESGADGGLLDELKSMARPVEMADQQRETKEPSADSQDKGGSPQESADGSV